MEGGGNQSAAGGTIRRSPRLSVHNKDTVPENMKLKNRRSKLRLPARPPSPPPNSESEHEDSEDVDFAPQVQADLEGSSRKRRRTQASVDATDCAQAPLPCPPAGISVRQKKRVISAIRCSPSKFRDIVKALDDDLKQQIRLKNFGGLLDFKPHELDRQLLSWLMRKLNPDTMKLELSGNQSIAITEHSVWCVFQIPNKGPDPTSIPDDVLRAKRKELAVQICGPGSTRISPTVIEKRLRERSLTGDIALRSFFMCAFQALLFSSTDCYIGSKNWCKAVVDNLSKAARLYKLDYALKGASAPINGCGIFLVMLYVDYLQHGFDLNPFLLPRCAYLNTDLIDKIAKADRRGDVPAGSIEFGNIRIKSLVDTCYNTPPADIAVAPVPILAAAPPQVHVPTSDPAGPSSTSAGTSHDPGSHSAINL